MPLHTHRTIATIRSNSDGTKVARWAWLIYATFVVYGSLIPFDFHPLPFDQAWAAFRHTPFLTLGVESRADWIANGVLYLPLGFLGVRALDGGTRFLPTLASLAFAGMLAFTVEFAQLSFPPRTVSQNDLLAECLGSLVGVVAARGMGPWLARWWQAWRTDSANIARLAWQAYALGYLLFCFFPFDFLVSRQEFLNKLDSGNWGWVFALPEASFTSWLRTLLLLVVEAALTIPIGVGLGAGLKSQQALRRGIFGGAMIGFLFEIGQIFIASGVSQGASLLSRAAGAGLGAWLGAGWRKGSLDILRCWLSQHMGWLLLAYLVLLGFASGWGSHAWLGWGHALRSWDELRFLPFYYHYFTTEAAALVSLGSVVVIYAPLAIIAWASMAGAAGTAVLAAMVALVLETGKLFMDGIHPDPTNVLLAGTSVWLLMNGINLWERQQRRVERTADVPPEHGDRAAPLDTATSSAVESIPKTSFSLPDKPWLIVLLMAIAWMGAGWPAYSWFVLGVVAAAAAATWWRPASLLVILPAAMPVFDFAPWSGRFFLDEFDLLCAACLAVGFARERPQIFRKRLSGRALVFLAMMLSLAIGALKAWGGSFSLDMNSFSSYLSPFNGMRIFKGVVWAWLFVAMYRSLVGRQPTVGRLLHLGFAVGLALTILVVLWERMAMVGLFDFTTDYRVTGPFSVMNKGGAYIECFLAVASAFVIIELATCRHRLLFWGVSALLVLAGYAILVTYSRNGFAALAGALLIGILTAWQTRRRSPGAMLPALLTIGMVTVAGGMALSGGYASERLGASEHDFETRLAHWRSALDLRDDGVATTLLGVGLGRFPESHFWGSRTEQRAAAFRIEPGGGNAFLRLAPGAPIYIEQIISPPPGKELDLSINVRSAGAPPKLAVTLCRKTLLTADECEQVEVTGIKAPGYWQNQYATIPPLPEPANGLAALVPVKISLVTPANGQAIDIDNISLRLPGTDHYLTRNGAFEKGMDHWFFATDIDPPWHIHSLPVALLFDLGWLGLAAALALMSVAVAGGFKALRYGQVEGIAAFAGLLAFLVSGSLNTLIDEPRFLWLWLVLAWVCGWQGARAKSVDTKSAA
ncbi:VanZ family protein [Ferribacterium limneticum]|uniref:VanZ family protein n=1 Tax=Ferribacterium limneticum TaxID=76259 RepID=UPI001CFBBB80|nr:VanZ family protein [Ferribacterium limneticum]UCV17375.1 VanZ family protein [Ferribacterium limneticum]